MLRLVICVIAALLASAGAAHGQESLRTAVSAAMGEALADSRYQQILAKYGLPAPDAAAQTALASAARNPYPARAPGTLLNHVLERGKLRIGWIRVGIPFSFVVGDGKLQGVAVDLWPLILEKMSVKYGARVAPDFVEFTSETGNNDMYQQLSRDQDPDCAALRLASAAMCYDIIGGAYAFNEPRKKVSAFTAAYYPLNMTGIRTPVPLRGKDGKEIPLDTPENILAAARNADAGVVFAALAATGEVQFLNGLKQRFGDTFKIVIRPVDSNILEFAQNTGAHVVLGTNARIFYSRIQTPQFCNGCTAIPNLQPFDGNGFATALPLK